MEDSQLNGELERDLLICYEPNAIKQLVQKLSTKITNSQLVYLSQKVGKITPTLIFSPVQSVFLTFIDLTDYAVRTCSLA